ncbi:hypothetical protein OUZ56_022374 [Daphnia magna]|uniref:Uncharacterized protein n=1 Tax=Daphnia magna TaxID=35525 RepID=A0ABR0AWA9_9CRUS|nr:hypothetical protein OUZ56_022374 [Daphnia magna]
MILTLASGLYIMECFHFSENRKNSHSMSSLVCLERDFHYYEIVGRDISGRPLRFHRSLY